jgi:hypothetical protein
VGVACGGVLAFGLLRGLAWEWAYDREAREWRIVSGRVEGPRELKLEGLSVVVSRGDRVVTRRKVGADGRFSVRVLSDEPIDLQVGDLKDPRNVNHALGNETTLHRVGRLEGVVRGLPSSAGGVTVRLTEVPTNSLVLRVTGPDGRAASGARVLIASMADRIQRTADTNGLVRVDDLPLRPWSVIARLSGGVETALVYARGTVIPSGDEVELDVPAGRPVRITIACRVPPDVELNFQTPVGPQHWVRAWTPDADGSMTLQVAPAVQALFLRAHEIERTGRTRVIRPLAEGAVALHDGAELVLTPIER